MMFSTKDKDNDENIENCAEGLKGGWWYNSCHRSNLNGQYLGAGERSAKGIRWHHWKNDTRSMKKSEMKIRPAQF
jgi:hypothetical protein